MKCLNRKTLIGIGVVALAVYFVAPSARGPLPVLFLSLCPLMMMFMMFGMSKMKTFANSSATKQTDPQLQIELKNAEIARLEAMLQNSKRTEPN